MMSQCNFAGTNLLSKTVQGAPTQARAQTTGGFSLRNDRLNNAVGVALKDVIRNSEILKVLRQHLLGEARLLLIKVDRNHFKIDRRAVPEMHQDVEHAVGVFTPRDTDHYPVAIFDHVEINNGITNVAPQSFAQFVEFVLFASSIS